MTAINVPTQLWDDDSPGVISTWLFEDGNMVSEGNVVAEVMNEKITFDILAPATGRLVVVKAVDEEVSQGDVIGRVERE